VDVNLQRTQKAFYYAAISFIDYQIGRIMAALEQMGELDNTLILLSADHGEMLGDYNCVGKRTMLDSAARIPLLARFPDKHSAGQRSTRAASLVDIMPTVLDAAGINRTNLELDGVNLCDLADGKVGQRYVYSQINDKNMGLYMVADDTKKYVYSAADDKEYFLDIQQDPCESHNLQPSDAHMVMKKDIIDTLHGKGYRQSVDGKNWVKYPILAVPEDPNAFLLFQDNYSDKSVEGNLPEGYKTSFPGARYLSL